MFRMLIFNLVCAYYSVAICFTTKRTLTFYCIYANVFMFAVNLIYFWKNIYKKETEMIVCACIEDNGKYYKGKNHAECFAKRSKLDSGKDCKQGFWTTHDRFVDRKEAGAIGFEAGQLAENPNGKAVYSEDFFSDQTQPLCKWDSELERYVKRQGDTQWQIDQ